MFISHSVVVAQRSQFGANLRQLTRSHALGEIVSSHIGQLSSILIFYVATGILQR